MTDFSAFGRQWLVVSLLGPLLAVPSVVPGQEPGALSFATARTSSQSEPEPPRPTAIANRDAAIIAADDRLAITVSDHPELAASYWVDVDGTVTLPLIGRLHAGGLTLQRFEDRLSAALAAHSLRNPAVHVEVDRDDRPYVFVIGEVRSPGKIALADTMSLVEALGVAGWLRTGASNELVILHPRQRQGPSSTPSDDQAAVSARVSVKDLQEHGGPAVLLQPGDIVYVPKAQTFFIRGHVRNPGVYLMDPDMTVATAIALAGGLTERGSDRGIMVIRAVNEKPQEIAVKITDIVRPNDTLQIRRSFF